AAFLQRVVDIRPRSLQRGNESEDQSGDERYAQGKSEHAAINSCLIETRNVGGRKRNQRAESPNREQQSHRAADHAQQNAFGEQLPNDPPAPRSEGQANRDFFFTHRGAREQQISDVRACDQQHKTDRAKQNQKRGPHGVSLLIVNQPEIDAVVRLKILFVQALGDRGHVCLRLRERHSGFDSSHGLQRNRVSRLLPLRSNRKGNPELSGLFRKTKTRRHHSDDCAIYSIEADLLPDDRRVAAKVSSPKPVAQNDNHVLAGLLLIFGEGAAKRGVYAEDRKQTGGVPHAHDAHGITGAREVEAASVERSHVFEDLVLLLVIDIVRI